MPKFDSLGDRMKFYEGLTGGLDYLLPLIPVIIRLDGKAFHTFTRGMDRPYDHRFIAMMIETTKYLVDETNALMGYTQSDEINLLLYSDRMESLLYMDGRPSKINSILAAKCSIRFVRLLNQFLPSKHAEIVSQGATNLPVFDCRCFNVPTYQEAINVFLWRELDAVRNSIQMAGQACFSAKQLHGKSCDQIQEMLWQEKQINWNDYPAKCKRGTYVRRRKEITKFTADEIEKLPPKHEARTNPDLEVERSVVSILSMPILTKVINQMAVFFLGDDPFVSEENKS